MLAHKVGGYESIMATAHEALPEISWRGEMCKGLLSTKTNLFRRLRGVAQLLVGVDTIRMVADPLRFNAWDFTIAKADVVAIEPAGFFPWFWLGIRIRHTNPELPLSLTFHTWEASRAELFDAFRTRGYSVG
jgi:hypothetical protein